MPSTPLEALAEQYVGERQALGSLVHGSAATVRSALRALCRSAGAIEPGQLSSDVVEAWLAGADYAPATARGRLSAVRVWCRWLVRRGHLASDPTAEVLGPREPVHLPRGIRAPLVAELLDVCPDARARLVVLMMVQQGLRCREVAALQVGDVDVDQAVFIVRGKGRRERALPLLAETADALDAYLQACPATAGPLVRSYKRPRHGISAGYVSTLVSEWLTAAGAGATAHALRHTAATDMLRAGAHVRDVQAALGHASLSTTQRYMPWLVGDLGRAMGGRRYGPAAARGRAPEQEGGGAA